MPPDPSFQKAPSTPLSLTSQSLDSSRSKTIMSRLWDYALSSQALQVYEERILQLVDILLERLDGFATTGEVIDLLTWIEYLGFDVRGKIALVSTKLESIVLHTSNADQESL